MSDASSAATRHNPDDLHHVRQLIDNGLGQFPLPAAGPAGETQAAQRWFDAHRDDVLAIVRTAVSEGHLERAAVLLTHTWPLVTSAIDDARCVDLTDLGASLLPGLPDSPVLASMFRASSGALQARGAYWNAEIEGMRELKIWTARDDLARSASVYGSLAWIFRRRGRMNRVLDCADSLLALYLRHDHAPGIAWTLCYRGVLMIELGRYDSAVDYLARGNSAYDEVSATPAQQRAEAAMLLGRALRHDGQAAPARRQFVRTLDLLADLDDEVTARLRSSVSTPADEDRVVSVAELVYHRETYLDHESCREL